MFSIWNKYCKNHLGECVYGREGYNKYGQTSNILKDFPSAR